MAKYIKQEMPDINGSGEKKCYYRIQTQCNVSMRELVEHISYPGSGLDAGSVVHVLQSLVEQISKELADGNSVAIDGLGIFKASLGLRDEKEMDAIEGDQPQHNAQSLQVSGINFRADKDLVIKTNSQCRLERGGVSTLHHSTYTKEQRLKLALDYLSDSSHSVMRIVDYQQLTGLSRSVATTELRSFSEDPKSGIDFIGRGPAKVYVKRQA